MGTKVGASRRRRLFAGVASSIMAESGRGGGASEWVGRKVEGAEPACPRDCSNRKGPKCRRSNTGIAKPEHDKLRAESEKPSWTKSKATMGGPDLAVFDTDNGASGRDKDRSKGGNPIFTWSTAGTQKPIRIRLRTRMDTSRCRKSETSRAEFEQETLRGSKEDPKVMKSNGSVMEPSQHLPHTDKEKLV